MLSERLTTDGVTRSGAAIKGEPSTADVRLMTSPVSRSLLGRLRSSADEGMTLVELMVALVVFGIASTGIAYGIMAATNTTRLDRDRVQASNLASREIEITRSEFTNTSVGATTLGASGTMVNPHPLPAGSAPDLDQFVVTRTVQWAPAGTGTSACDGGATVQYPSLVVDVKVTWAQMGNVQPVVSHTVLTPPKGSLNSNLGFAAIKVQRADGGPASGQVVKLTGPSTSTGTTADDGCAVFSLSSLGLYTASLSTTGYVDNFGIAAPSKTLNVQKGTLSQASFSYDKAATLTVVATAPAGYALPPTLPKQFQLYNTNIQPNFLKTVTAASATTVLSGLWPYSDGYALWPGSCTQSDPVRAGGARAASTVVAPGGSATVSLGFLPVAVHATNVNGDPLINATITVTPDNAAGCVSPETGPWTLGTTGADGSLLTSLPAGTWNVAIAGRTLLTPASTGSLTPGNPPVDVVTQINTLS